MSGLSQYDYELPSELIAQQPLANRSDARLLVVDRQRQTISHSHVRNLPEHLRAGDAIVLNDTRVVPARLVGRRTQTGGRWQGLYLEADESGNWLVMSKTRGKLTAGETVTLEDRQGRADVQLTLLSKFEDDTWAARPSNDDTTFDILDRVGRVPLPPYIRDGEMVDADQQTYQTVFAAHRGAVAAPTAGLHFTDSLLADLVARDVAIHKVTLHVGLGTFRPISVDRVDDHQMHEEWGRLDADVARDLIDRRTAGGRIISVGTTVVRVLETAAQSGTLAAWQGKTDLFIKPPYEFRTIDALMTNFHLPKTTLLVLVRTFGGDLLMRRAYEGAIREQYRFFSYGDTMLIL